MRKCHDGKSSHPLALPQWHPGAKYCTLGRNSTRSWKSLCRTSSKPWSYMQDQQQALRRVVPEAVFNLDLELVC